ncbi:hypothetical protein CDAR_185401 [Caerostris darwini]|uniref:Uncharacterized protein n=1 Tax=Caerostris darwini TaxID=1538125 RepID=A0AAV4SQZ4_9ARAC|nr:hypothetical protein CDAR_185401 [Caerostris darwini]
MGKILNTGSTPCTEYIIHIPLPAKITRFFVDRTFQRPELGQGGPLASLRHAGIMASVLSEPLSANESWTLFYAAIYCGFLLKKKKEIGHDDAHLWFSKSCCSLQ